MREINECTAEVFRRSEKRIKERKRNRNRILALCIPFCLIVTVWSVMILPAILPAGNNDTEENSAMELGDSNGQSLLYSYVQDSYVQVEIRNAGSSPEYYRKATDAQGVTEVFCVIHDLTFVDGAKPGDDLNADEEAKDKTGTANYSTGSKAKCIITFTTVDGAERVYVLSGSELLDEGTDKRILLSDEQLAELKTVLGLTQ